VRSEVGCPRFVSYWLFSGFWTSMVLLKGSGKLAIMLQILHLLHSAHSCSLDLCPIWVSLNNPLLQKADALNKNVDTDNWSVCQGNFDFLSSSYGPFTVDLFTNDENAKVARFFSFTLEDNCAGVDAFAFTWDGEWAYIAPPVSLVSKVIRKIAASPRLLIPLWGSPFFLDFCFSRWEASRIPVPFHGGGVSVDSLLGPVQAGRYQGQVGEVFGLEGLLSWGFGHRVRGWFWSVH
jgi:hypothetical protein